MMNHGKRLLCGLAALLLCAGMLSGCGKKTQTESEAENAPASSAAEPESSAEDGADPEQDAEAAAKNTAEAEEVLKDFLDGCLNHDLAAVDAAGDYRSLRAAISGTEFSDAEWQEEASGWLFDAFESYEIGAGSSRYQDLMDYDAGIRKFLNAEAENPDPADSDETLRCIAYLQDAYKRPEGYCEFPVTLKSGDGEQTDTLRLVKVEDKWQLELCESVVQQIAYNRARRDAFVGEANLTAEALYETVSNSLAEMSAQGIDVTVLSGDYLFTAADFELVNQPQTIRSEEEVLTELRRYIKRDAPEAAKCANTAIRMENGTCTAAAAETSFADGSFFGMHPSRADALTSMTTENISAALEAAAEMG